MNKFITKSNESKQCYNLAKMATEFNVNTLISGEIGTGRKLLAHEICEDCDMFEVADFEQHIKDNKLSSNTNIIIYNIDKANNLSYILKVASKYSIRIIATATSSNDVLKENFLVNIQTTPLKQRKEDIEYIKNIYFNDAKKIFKVDGINLKEIKNIDLSQNGISLKESIYKYLALNSLGCNQLQDMIEHHFEKKFILCEDKPKEDYKYYLGLLEIPLLKSAQKIYKSQLNISKVLGINRMTLRKKLFHYGLD
jgi:DNA-binding NtrC family response regulator